MIVEFIGSTGAGKTTLIKEVHRRLAKTARVTTSIDLATGLLGIQGLTNPTLQNFVQEFVSLPFFIGTFYRNNEFIRHTVKLFFRNSSLSIRTINNLRSLERKIGVYEISSRYGQDRIILVDEGPILAAHMFVFTGAAYTPEEISKFTDLLPLPDLVVYVSASVDTLVQRTLRRGDHPREINTKNLAQTEGYAKSAVTIFDQLVKAANIQQRLLRVESPDFAGQGYEKVVDDISEAILNRALLANGVNKSY
jgi:deoxyadenosine/deoxycytidine kinase